MSDVSSRSVPSLPLDARMLLRRINAELVHLRRALSHDHTDEPFWAALELDPPTAQRRRHALRPAAHLLHVARASSHGRIHGRTFDSLDAQAAWLAAKEPALAKLHAAHL